LRVTDLQGTNLYKVDLRGVDLRDFSFNLSISVCLSS
jgi:uncharacterized protein YjbI with pentapeptide repeats